MSGSEMGLDPSTLRTPPDPDGLAFRILRILMERILLADTDGDGIDDFQFTIALQPELPDRLDPPGA